jgi:hypothetical protein
LTRSKAIQPARAKTVTAALDKADAARGGSTAAAAAQLETLATQLDADGAAAAGRDASRFKALASTMRDRAAKMK